MIAHADKCPKGHVGRRSVSNGGCLECHRLREAKRRAEHPELYKTRRRTYQDRNPELCKERGRRWRQNNKTRWLENERASRERRRQEDPKGQWAISAICQARARAKKAGVPFDLTKSQLLSIATDKCPALGCDLAYKAKTGGGAAPNSATIDRIVPSLGYVPGNVVIISHRANTIKNDATLEQLISVADWLASITEELKRGA